MTFVISPSWLFSQTIKIDSLLVLLNKTTIDSTRLIILNNLSFEFWDVNPNTGLSYAKEALDLSEKIHSRKGTAEAYSNIGRSYRRMTNLTKALEFSFKSLKLYEEIGDKHGIASNLLNIGNTYRVQKDYEKSLEYLQRSLKINEEAGDKIWVARSLNSIGNVLKDQKKYSETIEYYTRSLKVAEEIQSKDRIAAAMTNLGSAYGLVKEYAKALDYDFKALKMYKEIGKKIGTSECYINIGMVYLDLSNENAPIQGFSKNFSKKEHLHFAKIYCDSAIYLDKEAGHLEGLQWDYKFLTSVFNQQEDFKGAFKSYEFFISIKDSISNSESNRRISQLEKSNEEDLKQKEIEIQKLQLSSAKKERNYFLLGISLLIIFAGVIFRSLWTTRKQKTLIEKKNLETEEQKKIIEEKNKDIMGSIRYAKRIQNSLLPTEKYIERVLNKKD